MERSRRCPSRVRVCAESITAGLGAPVKHGVRVRPEWVSLTDPQHLCGSHSAPQPARAALGRTLRRSRRYASRNHPARRPAVRSESPPRPVIARSTHCRQSRRRRRRRRGRWGRWGRRGRKRDLRLCAPGVQGCKHVPRLQAVPVAAHWRAGQAEGVQRAIFL